MEIEIRPPRIPLKIEAVLHGGKGRAAPTDEGFLAYCLRRGLVPKGPLSGRWPLLTWGDYTYKFHERPFHVDGGLLVGGLDRKAGVWHALLRLRYQLPSYSPLTRLHRMSDGWFSKMRGRCIVGAYYVEIAEPFRGSFSASSHQIWKSPDDGIIDTGVFPELRLDRKVRLEGNFKNLNVSGTADPVFHQRLALRDAPFPRES